MEQQINQLSNAESFQFGGELRPDAVKLLKWMNG